jgi:hypothetical protein
MTPLAILQAVLALVQACAPVVALLLIGLYGRQQQATGGKLANATTDQATAKVETAVAQAEAAGPTTSMAILDRLKAGTL